MESGGKGFRMEGCGMRSKKSSLLRGLLFLLVILFALGGCGSTGGMDRGDGDDGDGGETPVTETVGNVVLSASESPARILADGQSSIVINAQVFNQNGLLISRPVTVNFSTTAGTFAQATATTVNGTASATLISSTQVSENVAVQASAEQVAAEESLTVAFLPVPDQFSVSASLTTLQSDNSDQSIITVTVLDADRVPIGDFPVNFRATGGQLSASSVLTGPEFDEEGNRLPEHGQARVTFQAGQVQPANQTVTISVQVDGIGTKTIPIQIVGTTITLSADKSNLDLEKGDKGELTVSVRDSGDNPIFDAEVTAVVIPGAPGNPDVPQGNARLRLIANPAIVQENGVLTGRTNTNGELRIEVEPLGAGRVTVEVSSLGDRKTQTYVIDTTARTFAIISPASSPVALSVDQFLDVTVRNPSGSPVRFSTTFGNWGNGGQVVDVPVGADNIAVARLVGREAGVASVQVSDTADTENINRASLRVAIAAPSSSATQVVLQANPAVVEPSSGNVTNTSTLTATVRNADDQVVGNAPVAFSIEQTTGGGEAVFPVIAFTDASGVATTTFSSGTLSSSGDGVRIRAVVLSATERVEDTVSIVIGRTSGSILIGRGTTIQATDDATSYILPMTVLVTDSNGNAVPGARVTLGSWPTRYRTGFWTLEPCVPVVTGVFLNEDQNRNLILDAGEDVNGTGDITPPNSASGAVGPPLNEEGESGGSRFVVTTGQDGLAAFRLTYIKTSAVWIETEISASTTVFGSETRSTFTDWLPFLDGEECELPDSPYNVTNALGRIDLSAGKTALLPDGVDQTIVRAFVRDAGGNPAADDTPVTFALSGPGSLSEPVVLTSSGVAEVIYVSGTTTGIATITASSEDVLPDTIELEIARGQIILTPDRLSLFTNGTDEVQLNAQVFDLDGNFLTTPTQVVFTVLQGPAGLSSISGLQGSSGNREARIPYSGGTVTAFYKPEEGASGTAIIEVRADGVGALPDEARISLNSEPIGSVSVTTDQPSISVGADDFATISATILSASGGPASAGTSVSFSVSGPGTFSDGAPTSVVRNDGIVSARLFGVRAGTAVVTVSSGGMSDKVTVEVQGQLADVAQINLNATPNPVPPGADEFATITATVLNANNQPAPVGTQVDFSIAPISLDPRQEGLGRLELDGPGSVTNEKSVTATVVRTDGVVTVRLLRASSDESGTVVIEAESGAVSQQINVVFQAEDPDPLIQGLTVSSNQETITADESGTAVIAATVETVEGQSEDGVKVDFRIISGTGDLSAAQSETVGGVARVTLTGAGGSLAAGTSVTVRAEAQGFSDTVQVNYARGSLNLAIVSPGSGSQVSIRSGESVAIQAKLDDAGEGELVTFSMDNPSLGALTPLTATTTADTEGDGIATTTFRSTGPGGTVKVRASAPLYAEQSVTINIGSAPPAFIEQTEAFPSPAFIGVRGTQGPSASIVSFDVKDATGADVSDGFRFDFEIVSGPNGGEELLIPFAATSEGKVSTTLRTGTKPGPVLVRATYHEDANVATTSSQIAIQSGLPVGEEFGLRTSANVDGGNFDIGRQMCVSVADIYGNSVVDGTVVNVKTYNTGGFINEPTISTEGGTGCTTLFFDRVGNTQPFNGVISVTSETTGDITTRVNAFAVHAENPFSAVVYAATNGGGVYKSTDSGTTWRSVSRSTSQVGQNWIGPYVNDIVIDPQNPNIVYAATGYGGKGNIFQSLDGGITWDSNNDFFYDGILATPTISILTLAIDDASSTPNTPVIWAGTDGFGVLKLQADSRAGQLKVISIGLDRPRNNFEQVNDIVKVPGGPVLYAATETGVYRSTDAGDTWLPRNDPPFTGYFINTLELHPSSTGGGNDVIYAGTRDNGVWVSTDSGINWTQVPGLGKALRVTTPIPDRGNVGSGEIVDLELFDSAISENWTLEFFGDNSLGFELTGSVSGQQPVNEFTASASGVIQFAMTNISDGMEAGEGFEFQVDQDREPTNIQKLLSSGPDLVPDSLTLLSEFTGNVGETWKIEYQDGNAILLIGPDSATEPIEINQFSAADVSVPNQLEFTISNGAIPFQDGDHFTFTTVSDDGKHIKDLLVDSRNDLLYALTYFDGALESHATSNLFSRELESNGVIGPGGWQDSGDSGEGLPQFAPPSDQTPFAHWALASVPESDGRPNEPKALLVGGEDVNISKASSGLETGEPNWTRSDSGLSRLIMARVPVLIDFPETADDRAVTFGPFSGTRFFRFELTMDGLVEFEVSYIGEGALNTTVSGLDIQEEIELGEIVLGGSRSVRRELPAGIFSLQGTETRDEGASIGNWQVTIKAISPVLPVD